MFKDEGFGFFSFLNPFFNFQKASSRNPLPHQLKKKGFKILKNSIQQGNKAQNGFLILGKIRDLNRAPLSSKPR